MYKNEYIDLSLIDEVMKLIKERGIVKWNLSQYEWNKIYLEIGDAEINLRLRILYSTSSVGQFLKIQVMQNMMYHKCFSIEFYRCQITI